LRIFARCYGKAKIKRPVSIPSENSPERFEYFHGQIITQLKNGILSQRQTPKPIGVYTPACGLGKTDKMLDKCTVIPYGKL
jgi:hypothetical protein